jgi:hypothetical protein
MGLRNMNDLILNLDKLHTTQMGVVRIKRNLCLTNDNVVEFCKNAIKNTERKIYRNGKNWYVEINDMIITINAHSFTIITAHIAK